MDLIYIILLSSISIYGLHACIWKLIDTFLNKNIEHVRFLLKQHNKTLYLSLMPILFCRLCMSSFLGSIFYWTYGWILGGATVTAWILSILAIAGILAYLIRTEK